MAEISKEKQQELQKKYMELQMLSQQINQTQKQIGLLAEQMQELTLTNEALNDLKNTNTGTEMLAPMASGIFVKANIADNKEVLLNVGAKTTVKKTIPQAEKLIKKQLEQIEQYKNDMESNLNELTTQSQKFEKELSGLTK